MPAKSAEEILRHPKDPSNIGAKLGVAFLIGAFIIFVAYLISQGVL